MHGHDEPISYYPLSVLSDHFPLKGGSLAGAINMPSPLAGKVPYKGGRGFALVCNIHSSFYLILYITLSVLTDHFPLKGGSIAGARS